MTYPDSVRRAGFSGDGPALGEALFEAIFQAVAASPSRSTSTKTPGGAWRRPTGASTSRSPSCSTSSPVLRDAPSVTTPAFPFVLSAGERRSSTANTIVRDPAFRKRDSIGLRMSRTDAQRLGVERRRSRARRHPSAAAPKSIVELSDTLQAGHVSLPNGLGLAYPDPVGDVAMHGVAPNELTASEHRDWLAGTPWHKHVPARIEPLQ